MVRRPPRSTRTDTRCPYTTRFRSRQERQGGGAKRGHVYPSFGCVVDPRRAVAESTRRRRPAKALGRSAHPGVPVVPRRPCHSGGNNEARSEEHTSELQSLMRISYAVFCLKKKKQKPQYETSK